MAAPVKPTCPDIDKGIKRIQDAMRELNGEIEDKRVERSVFYDLSCAIDVFEQLRSDNDELRKWGKEMEDEVESTANYINELEEKLDKLSVPLQ
jgi:uncharacterized coiled-coil DUF342 family protein